MKIMAGDPFTTRLQEPARLSYLFSSRVNHRPNIFITGTGLPLIACLESVNYANGEIGI